MYNVLIVDDEPIVKIALRSILSWEEYGFFICGTASDGMEALTLIDKYRPDLIITDLKMPNMDGLTLIRKLKEQNYSGEILVISNYEDFDYVRSALVMGATDYILKISIKEDDLIQHLKKISNKLDSSRTQKNITQEYTLVLQEQQHSQMQEALKEYLESPDYSLSQLFENSPVISEKHKDTFTLCYFNFDRYIQEQSRLISRELIQNTILESFKGIPDCEILYLNRNNILVFVPVFSLKKQNIQLTSFMSRLPSLFQLYLSVSPVIIYEDQITGFDELKEWYRIFQHILDLNFYGELAVVHAKECLPVHYINFIYYKDMAQTVWNNNASGMEKSLTLIQSVIKKCSKLHIYPEIIKTFFEKTIELLEYLNHDISLETHEFLMEAKENIRSCSSSEELLLLVTLSIQAIFQPVITTETDQAVYKEEILQAIQYINRNYHRKISLAAIAKHVNLSSGYLCRLFKAEVGTSLTSYINDLRMKKAGELIKKQDTYLKEVAISVGIEDQLYFSRLFKKHYGMAPSEYKAAN